jgi:SOS-response transcriptional repressor LexA
MPASTRTTKKQRELFNYIERFTAQHGYSPTYREIESELGYSSVATVAAHVDNLIEKGLLKKSDREARSLVIIKPSQTTEKELTRKYIVAEVSYRFTKAEHGELPIRELKPLVEALKALGFTKEFKQFQTRLSRLRTS